MPELAGGCGCEVVFMTTAHRWSITFEELSAEYREGAPCSSRTGERGDFRLPNAEEPQTLLWQMRSALHYVQREGEGVLPQFWQKRFYDFNVYSAAKKREKLEYMHRNPVTRRLVKDPKDWVWSSYSSYSGRGTPLVEIDFVN
jgi:hypothetical protein